MKQLRNKIVCIQTALVLASLICSSWVMAAAQTLTDIPSGARIWEKHSVAEGAEYSDYRGGDVAFINNGKGAWYYLVEVSLVEGDLVEGELVEGNLAEENSGENETSAKKNQWRLFHEGNTLDLANADDSITETLQYEVISGTAFFANGPPGMYQMLLDGISGNLITSGGVSFNPNDFDALRDANGQAVLYNYKSDTWWSSNPNNFGTALTQTPVAPYTPMSITAGSIPGRRDLDGIKAQLTFDIDKRLYHTQGLVDQVIGFHHSVVGRYREWKNESDMPCASYGGYPGISVAYVNNVWYSTRDDDSYQAIVTGRHLSFDELYTGTVFLRYALTAGTPIGSDGPLDQLNLRLDGETGELVDSSGQAIDPERYASPDSPKTTCGMRYTLLLNEPLMIKGLAGPPLFKARSTSVTLMRVVPLYNIKNDPFNDLTLPLAINEARAIRVLVSPVVSTPITVTPPDDVPPVIVPPIISPPIIVPPPSGSCPVNSNLSLIAAIPSQSPLGNVIGISSGTPALLNAGFAVAPSEEAIKFTATPTNSLSASVSLGSGFSLVSGNLGNVTEGSSNTYRVSRNIDGAEFEVSFTINVDIVFDDNGVIITSLTARQCTAGGPV